MQIKRPTRTSQPKQKHEAVANKAVERQARPADDFREALN